MKRKVVNRLFACLLAVSLALSSAPTGTVHAEGIPVGETVDASKLTENSTDTDASSTDENSSEQSEEGSAETSNEESSQSSSETTSNDSKSEDSPSSADASDSSSEASTSDEESSEASSSEESSSSEDTNTSETNSDASSSQSDSTSNPQENTNTEATDSSDKASSADATSEDTSDEVSDNSSEANSESKEDEDALENDSKKKTAIEDESEEAEEESEEDDELTELEKRLKSGELSDDELADLKEEYLSKVDALNGGSYGTISNEYLEAAIDGNGQFTFGTIEGNPNYTTDNNAKLLYGHPSPWSSETLITVDGREYRFEASDVATDDDADLASAIMYIDDEGISVYQNISFYTNPTTGRADTAHVTYSVTNSSGTAHNVGVRIMLDTMLKSNDYAPFKINGIGNVTNMLELTGNAITQTYQVYDDLDNPTTIAGGTLWLTDDERKPDKVQYCGWPGIHGSSWNHQIDPDDNLGDSAVGIYYNPVSLGSGKTFIVGTYYGTGLGLTGNDSDDGSVNTTPSSTIPKDAIDVHVIDPSTRKSISGVTVTIDGVGDATTDNTGKARFSGLDSTLDSQNLNVTLAKEGYATTTRTFTLKTGMPFYFYLRNNNDNSPIVTGVTMTSSNAKYNNKDLLSSVVTFVENATGVEAKDNINKEVVTINVAADFADGDDVAAYQLVQDKMTVMDSKDGVFKIDTVTNNLNGKNYTENRVCGFSANKKIYLRAISRNGEMSNLVALGIDVKAASDTTILLSGSDDAFGTIDFGKIDSANQILEIFFGDNRKIKMPKVPIKVKVTEEGKVRVAITGNALSKADLDWDSFKEKYNDDYARAIVNTSRAMKNTMVKGQHAESMGVGNLSVSLNFEGYGEGYISDGQLKIEVGVIATLSGEASHTHTFFVGWVPLYIKVGGGAELESHMKAKAGLFGEKPYLKFYWGTFKPSINLYAELGAGASGILSAGVQGKGVLEGVYDFDENYTEVNLTASAAITVHALLYHNEFNIAQHTWNLCRDTGFNNTAPLNSGNPAIDNLFDLDAFTLNSRNYTDVAPLNTSVDNEMEYGVYTDARPVMVKAGSKSYLFWIDDDDSEGLNYSHIYYSVCDEDSSSWSDKQLLVDGDDTSDYAFDVAVSGNKVYVIYQEADHKYDYDEYSAFQAATGSEGIATLIQDSQISLTVIDASGTVNDVKNISNHDPANTLGDISPRAYADGTNVHVIWYNNTLNTVMPNGEETGTTTIKYNTVSESAYAIGTPAQVASADSIITSMDLGRLNGTIQAAYVTDTDKDLATISDREVYIASDLSTDNSSQRVTQGTSNADLDESPQFVTINGTDALMWYGSDNYYYTTTDAAAAVAAFDEDVVPSNINNNFAVINEGTTATDIIWISTSSDSDSEYRYAAVYGSKFNGTDFDQPFEFAKTSNVENPMISSLTGIIEGGKAMATFQLVKYDEDGSLDYSSICGASEETRKSIEVVAYSFDSDEASDGNTIPVKVILNNTGTETVDAVTLHAGDSVAAISGMSLTPGTEKEFEVDVTLPDDSYTAMLDMSVSLENGDVTDDTETKMPFNYTNVAVTSTQRIMIANTEYFMFTVTNKSNVTASGINFKVITDDAENGTIVMDHNLEDDLVGKESVNLFCPADSFGSSVIAYSRLVTSTDEFQKQDNIEMVCVNAQAVDSISSCNVNVVSANTEAGTVTSAAVTDAEEDQQLTANSDGNGFSGTTLTNKTVNVSAAPVNGFSFTGWEITGDATINDRYAQDATVSMGDEDAEIKATFKTTNHLTGITIDSEKTLNYKQEYSFEPTLVPTETSDHLLWSSNDESIVTVDTYGNVKAVGIGDAEITATSSYTDESGDPIEAVCIVHVINVDLEGLIVLTPEIQMHGIGVQKRMDIITYPLNASNNIEYSSSNPSVVSVDNTGLMTSVATGTATITASANGMEGSCTVTVDLPPLGIFFEVSPITLIPGEDYQLRILSNPEDSLNDVNANDIAWSVEDDSVASLTVAPDHKTATVKGLYSGSTKVRVRIGQTLFTTVKIIVKQPIMSLSMSKTSTTMKVGKTAYLYANKTPYNAEGEIKWSTSNSSVVSLSADDDYAYLTAKKEGTAVITATADTGVTAKCTVTVTKKKSDQSSGNSSASNTQPNPSQSQYAAVGTEFTVAKMVYTVSGEGTVTLKKCKNTKATGISVGFNTVSYKNASYKVTGIGSGAFKKRKNLKTLTVGGSVKSMSAGACQGCKKLKIVNLASSGITSLPNNAFKDCTGLKTLTVNGNVLKSVNKSAIKGTKAKNITVNIKTKNKKTFKKLKEKFKNAGLKKAKFKQKKK